MQRLQTLQEMFVNKRHVVKLSVWFLHRSKKPQTEDDYVSSNTHIYLERSDSNVPYQTVYMCKPIGPVLLRSSHFWLNSKRIYTRSVACERPPAFAEDGFDEWNNRTRILPTPRTHTMLLYCVPFLLRPLPKPADNTVLTSVERLCDCIDSIPHSSFSSYYSSSPTLHTLSTFPRRNPSPALSLLPQPTQQTDSSYPLFCRSVFLCYSPITLLSFKISGSLLKEHVCGRPVTLFIVILYT